MMDGSAALKLERPFSKDDGLSFLLFYHPAGFGKFFLLIVSVYLLR